LRKTLHDRRAHGLYLHRGASGVLKETPKGG